MNVGIIGLGRIGKVHIAAIQKVKGLTIVSISDIDEERCREIASEYDIPNYTKSFSDIVTDKNIDALWICSPSKLHYQQVSEALQNNKYVFCEKPLETDVSKIKKLINDFPDLNNRLMVGFNRRFDSEFMNAKENLSKIGKTTIVKITSRDPVAPPLDYVKVSGGIFKDMMIHDFDMARFIVGDEVAEVYATGSVNYVENMEGIDVDTALVTLKFKNGVICNIDNSRQSVHGYDQRLEVLGTDGLILVDNKKVNQNNIYTKLGKQSSVYQYFFLERYADAYVSEAQVFIACITDNKEFSATAYDALKALELSEACNSSLLEKRVISLNA